MFMNHYTCMKCGVISVIGSREPELKNVKCGCGVEPVTYKLGKHELESPAPQNTVAPTMMQPAKPKELPQAPVVFNPSTATAPIASSAASSPQPPSSAPALFKFSDATAPIGSVKSQEGK